MNLPKYIDSSNLTQDSGAGVTVYLQPDTLEGIASLAMGMQEGGAFAVTLSVYDRQREAIRYATEVGLAALREAGAFEPAQGDDLRARGWVG